jgi:hypothetical protein
MTHGQTIRLCALDETDLEVISSLMQDCLIKVGDWLYDPNLRSFTCLGLRYCHELGQKSQRASAVLRIDGVLGVRSRGLQTEKSSEKIISLLSIRYIKHPDPECAPEGELVLTFAEKGEIVLKVECVDVLLMDRGAARPAKSKPKHGA